MRDTAQAFELAVLQNAQKLRLHLQRQLADFIEKQRAAMSQLEPSDALRRWPGERAFFVAEQFAFDQARRDRRAIQLHERALAAAGSVDGSRAPPVLCRSRFRHGSAPSNRWARRFRSAAARAQRRAVADDFIEAILAANFLFEIHFFVFDVFAQLADFLERQSVFVRRWSTCRPMWSMNSRSSAS